MSGCEFCGHARHDGVFCSGTSDNGLHRCACSYPDPSNYAEVPPPWPPDYGWHGGYHG